MADIYTLSLRDIVHYCTIIDKRLFFQSSLAIAINYSLALFLTFFVAIKHVFVKLMLN